MVGSGGWAGGWVVSENTPSYMYCITCQTYPPSIFQAGVVQSVRTRSLSRERTQWVSIYMQYKNLTSMSVSSTTGSRVISRASLLVLKHPPLFCDNGVAVVAPSPPPLPRPAAAAGSHEPSLSSTSAVGSPGYHSGFEALDPIQLYVGHSSSGGSTCSYYVCIPGNRYLVRIYHKMQQKRSRAAGQQRRRKNTLPQKKAL